MKSGNKMIKSFRICNLHFGVILTIIYKRNSPQFLVLCNEIKNAV